MSKRENMFRKDGKVKGGNNSGGRLSTIKKDGSGSNGGPRKFVGHNKGLGPRGF